MPDSSAMTNASPNNGDLDEMRLQLDSLTESQLRFNVALEGGDRLGRQFGRTLTNAFVGSRCTAKALVM